jgi:hypothetical protein
MKTWSVTNRAAREATLPADDAHGGEPHLYNVTREGADGVDSVYREMQQTQSLELADGLCVHVRLDEQNAQRVLESTQRLRERHERERAAVPPVYDFGGDSWAGGDA